MGFRVSFGKALDVRKTEGTIAAEAKYESTA
jgi:hypothetical protein